MLIIRLLLAFVILSVGGGATARTAAPAVSGWQAVLVAGDNAEPVFDNAVAAMDRWLVDRGVPQQAIHQLSAAPRHPQVERATLPRVLGRIATLRPHPGEGCFVFITSHGGEDNGVWLAASRNFLWPISLARALASGCRDAPTVVIVSSCYSGAFAHGSMQAPNRIILTAARADRPSFGCQADRTYTVYDQCLLTVALPHAPSWRVVFRRELGCVSREEHRVHALPSQPQAFFGAAVRRLAPP
ncbi:MAG TPA: C13 family peptidase [Stellaceae bacterium]|nr:C13 family peptidase [Stellaceae bacterium]